MSNQERFFDVVIVGSGLAGLAAGFLLDRQGLKTCVVEARTRPGGRICTIREPRFNVPVELGGEFVGRYHTTVHNWCNRFDLQLKPRLDGSSPKQLLPEKIIFDGLTISDSHFSQLNRELEDAVDKLIRLARNINPVKPWHSPIDVSHFNFMTVDQWLHQQGYSQSLREIFSDLGPSSQSMLGLLALVAGGKGKAFFSDSEAFTFEGGTSSLVEILTCAIGDIICLNSPVHCITIENNGVIVKSRQTDGSLYCYRSKALILTVPPPCWHSISGLPPKLLSLTPSMSHNRKLSLIVELAGINHPFEQLCVLTNGPCRLIWVNSIHEVDQKLVAKVDILACPFLSHTYLTQLDLVNTSMMLCHLEHWRILAIYEEPWDNSCWTQGTYPIFGPGHLDSNYNFILQGLPPLFFAGDYTIPAFAGYMEGALRSAEKAVEQVISFL